MVSIITFIFFFVAPIILVLYTRNVFALLLLFIFWIIDIVLLWFYTGWREIVGLTTPKITFRQFIALYNVMPENFVLNNYDIKYNDESVDFKTFIDVMRYRHFHKRIEKYKNQRKQLQRQAALIADLQRGLAREQADIDGFMEENLAEAACGGLGKYFE